MATKTLLSLATVSLLAFAAKADTQYTVETTNSWFSVKAADPLTSNWSGATPTSENDLINVDTEAGSPALYTAPTTAPRASRYRVTGNMTVTLNAGVPANTVFGGNSPKAALVAVAGSPNKWYGWDGDSWEDLSSEDPSLGINTPPVEGDPYNVAIEFFVEDSHLKIKYIVGDESCTVQHSILTTLLPSTLTQVGLAGYGSFGDFGALGFDSVEVTIDAGKEAAVKAALGIDEGDEITPAALNEVGKNGLTKWQSLVLGIGPNATTKPYTAPVQTAEGNKLGFAIGNYGTPLVDGNVTFDVYECDAQGVISKEKETPVGSANAGLTAEVTAPPANDGVKYYKIKIKFQ